MASNFDDKIDQNDKGLAFTFALFSHFLNILKMLQKGVKPRTDWLKIIVKSLAFVFEPFLKSSKSGQN